MEKPIEVYVELAGKEKYHQSLKGKDEPNQHPIAAITNLSEELESIKEGIADNKTDIEELSETTDEKITALQTSINNTKTDIINDTNKKIEEVQTFVQEELSNIDLEAYYTKDETDEKLEGVFHYKGSVPDFESLPLVCNKKGDVYNVQCSGANYVWTGCSWDNLSPAICLKGYATKDYVDGTLEASVRLLQNHLQVHYYEKQEIDEKLSQKANISDVYNKQYIDEQILEINNQQTETVTGITERVEEIKTEMQEQIDYLQEELKKQTKWQDLGSIS